jgi:UDP-glucose 4-epimerase
MKDWQSLSRDRRPFPLNSTNDPRADGPILVTGGAGFVGTTLVADLLAESRAVVVYDSFFTGSRPLPLAGLTVVEGDVRDETLLLATMQEHAPAAVIHLAALHYIPYCDAHPVDTMHVNVVGTQALLEACRATGVPRLVFASSAAVYGISSKPHREDDAPEPQDVYGLSKHVGEQQVAAFHRTTGTPCVMARLFNVFGRGETNPHVIPEILRQLADGQDSLHLGNLTPRRDYVHVTDVSRALRMFAGSADPACGTYNVGTSRSVSVADIVAELEAILGRPVAVEQAAGKLRPVDRPNLQADNSRLHADFGWSPETTLSDGLRDLASQLSAQGEATPGRTGA